MLPIKTNRLDVLDSWSLIVPDLGDTSFKMDHNGDEVTIVLEIADDGGQKPLVEVSVPNPQTMKIKVTNWGGHLSTSFAEPMRVGLIGGRPIFVLFSITRLGPKSNVRQVVFTTYLGEEVANAQA